MGTRQVWVRRVLLVILVLGVCGAGCLALELWAVYVRAQIESLESDGRGVVEDPTLFATAVTEVDYDAIVREILEQQIGRRDLSLYDGVWVHQACAEVGFVPEYVWFHYFFSYYGATVYAHVRIHPHQGKAEWSFVSSSPTSADDLDLPSRQVHIPQAIRIIEANSRENFRQTEEGDCEIWVDFESAAGDDVWLVRYKTSERMLCGFVDSQTGDYSINVVDNTDGSWFCPPPQ